MYKNIMLALDGSKHSNHALEAGVKLAEKTNAKLTGCHVYAAKLHRVRFTEMESGLPSDYQSEDKLTYLRDTHELIISDGLEIISDAYLKPMHELAKGKNLTVQGITPEGHNYVEFLKSIKTHDPDLVIMGARGHGTVPEGRLGSFCERVALGCRDKDMLITRNDLKLDDGLIVVGVDGSKNSYTALDRAIKLAKLYNSRLALVAVYDPFFHTGVFRNISDVLSQEEQNRFNFQAQEKLHDEIIDSGLEKIYRDGLMRGIKYVESQGLTADSEVLSGKVYPEILKYAKKRQAALIVTGRWGLHREDISLIGSNTANLLRETDTNLLIIVPTNQTIELPEQKPEKVSTLKWTPDAEAYLKRVPGFARGMARKSIEAKMREKGVSTITLSDVEQIGHKMGMGKTSRSG